MHYILYNTPFDLIFLYFLEKNSFVKIALFLLSGFPFNNTKSLEEQQTRFFLFQEHLHAKSKQFNTTYKAPKKITENVIQTYMRLTYLFQIKWFEKKTM
jgi:hypothetical protein